MNYAQDFRGAPERHHDPFAIPSVTVLLGAVAIVAALAIVIMIVGMTTL